MRTLDPIPVLLINEVAQVLGLSIPTVRRRLRDARKGKGRFPLTIGEPRQKLIWDREAILAYMSGTSQVVNCPKFETPGQKKKRNDDALDILKKDFGIKVKPQ